MLAPTWLYIVLPAYAIRSPALIAFGAQSPPAGPARAGVGHRQRARDLAAVQYRPSAYSNPMRVILRGPLGYRSRLLTLEQPAGGTALTLDTRVVLAVDRFLYAPATRSALWLRRRACAAPVRQPVRLPAVHAGRADRSP